MSSRATNLIDFAKAIGCFCIVWYHSSYYWSLNAGNRHLIDLVKLYLISWAMPFFYISAFYFITRYGTQNESAIKVLRKMGKIFSVQVLVIIIYGIYRLSVNLFLKDYSLQYLMTQFFNDLSIENSLLVFKSGNSTPAYFLAQVFFLYLPLYLVGRIIAITRYFSAMAIGSLLVMYFFNVENSFISTEVYVYLTVSIALLTINLRKMWDDSVYKTFFFVSAATFAIWRMNYGEFILFGLAIWGAFSFLGKRSRTSLLVAKISRFGAYYSLFVFVFHLLYLDMTENLLLRLNFESKISGSSQISFYILVNILAFCFTAITAVLLNRFGRLRLKI